MGIVQDLIEKHDRKTQTTVRSKVEYFAVAYLIVNPKDDQLQIHELPIVGTDLSQYMNQLIVVVSKSNHHGFAQHRFAVGTIISGGRIVFNFSPSVKDIRSENPVFDMGTWNALFALLSRCQDWQEADTTQQIQNLGSRRVERKPGGFAAPARGLGGQNSGKTERARAKGKAPPKQT